MKTITKAIIGVLVYIGSLFACCFGTNMAVENIDQAMKDRKAKKNAKAEKLLSEADDCDCCSEE